MTPTVSPAHHDDPFALDPNPLAARDIGVLVGMEMLRAAWITHHMGVEFDVLADWDDEICPPWPAPPQVPAHVWPYALDDVDDGWVLEYHRGLTASLTPARGWVREAPVVVEAMAKSQRAIDCAAAAGS